MLRIFGILGAIMAAGQAAALSCIVPNFGRDFNHAAEAEASYYVAVGQLTPKGPLPRIPAENPSRQTEDRHAEVDFQFSGRLMGLNGPGPEREFNVRVRVDCLAAWCGGFPPVEREALMMLEMTSTGALLRVGPCGGAILNDPDASDLRVMGQCLKQGECREAELEHFENRYR